MKRKAVKKPKSERAKDESPDSVTQAAEEGDPKVSGRSHGRIVGHDGAPVTERNLDTTDENWESGRHDAD